MEIVIFCSIVAFGIIYMDSSGIIDWGMKSGFILVTFLAAIHYDYGNDYMAYYKLYLSETNYEFDILSIFERTSYRDPGWIMLCYLFKPFGGFFTMVAVLNILQNFLVYKTITKYIDRKWWWLGAFIYLFSTNFYLVNFSMMRQGLCVCIFFGIWPWIVNRKWYFALPVIAVLTTLHGSTLLLVPFAFWGYLPVKNNKVWTGVYILSTLTLYFNQTITNNLLQSVLGLNERFDEYADTYGKDEFTATFGIGFIIHMIPFVLTMFYLWTCENDTNREIKLILILASIGSLITPFSIILPSLSRIGKYFSIYEVITIPYVYSAIRESYVRRTFIAIFLLITFYDYIMFFYDTTWIEHFAEFHTIFDVIL